MAEERIYLNCPFDDKDECKSLGGRWDGDEKKWFITSDMNAEPFAKWMGEAAAAAAEKPKRDDEAAGEKIYLNCPYDDKEECKALGGRWDGDAKKWYVPAGKDADLFAKWL